MLAEAPRLAPYLHHKLIDMAKASIAKGMRDFTSSEVLRREYIINVIRNVFEAFGYGPLETPSMENLETLTGKYGDEGDKLIFRVLKSGDFLKSVPENLERNASAWTSLISDKALRYDLTVPFARFLANNRNDIKLPFKRFQIQPVWRADRPQKGRFREFYQCDADVVGSNSLWQEVELMQMYARVFDTLLLPVKIRISSRKILADMAEFCGVADRFMAFCIILDKVDKVGVEEVVRQWVELGVPIEKAQQLIDIIALRSEPAVDALKALGVTGKGLEEVSWVIEKFSKFNSESVLEFDPSLARGLDYYTGCIFEVEALNSSFGSLGGGGRYADLTGIFGLKDVPGVGISFGLDRIFLALEEADLFPDSIQDAPDVLGVQLSEDSAETVFRVVSQLRDNYVIAEFYPDAVKLKKQLDYAHQRGIRYVVIIGENELANNTLQLKDMKQGEQFEIDMEDFMENPINYLDLN